MSDGNRSERFPPWVKALGSIGLALAAAAVLSGLFYQIRYAQQANYGAAEYARNAAYESYKPCRVSPIAKLEQCLANAKREYDLKSNDNRRDYADLVAQQRSALWTGIMGIAALIGMALSAVGVWLIWTTFRETRRTAEIAQSNLVAYQQAERGFAHIEGVFRKKVNTAHFTHQYIFKISNPGRSGIKITRITTAHRDNGVWDWEGAYVFGGNTPQYCKVGKFVIIDGTFDLHVSPGAFVILGIIEYQSLGITELKSHFCFAANIVAPDEAKFTRLELPGMPDDT